MVGEKICNCLARPKAGAGCGFSPRYVKISVFPALNRPHCKTRYAQTVAMLMGEVYALWVFAGKNDEIFPKTLRKTTPVT